MTHLFYVRFSGDEQGTVLERKLKEIVRQDYNNSVCTEAAVQGIYRKLCEDCKDLSETKQNCKPVRVRLFKDSYNYNYRIELERPNGGCNYGNCSLLYFCILSAYYMHTDETLWSIADDNACRDWTDDLSVYNI